MSSRLSPSDRWNEELVQHVRPADWVQPTPIPRYNLLVLGGGTAGLVAAAGAAGLGARVALVERHLLGGDCLNAGCVPSKALIRAARAAHAALGEPSMGVVAEPPALDFGVAMERLRRLRAGIAHNDSAARFRDLGVDVFLGDGRFVARDAVEVGGQTLRFHRAVIATGSRAVFPSIPGLLEAGALTNETLFSLTELPPRLAVIGGGPIGSEMAQAFARFGAQVTIVERNGRLLHRDDPDAGRVVGERMRREGIRLLLGASVTRVELSGVERRVTVAHDGREEVLAVDAILVSAGRAAVVEGLGLSEAGVAFDPIGVTVNDGLRTTNRRIWAAGDVASRFKFTHAADAMARIVLRNALFAGRAKASALVIPWATYTSPEVAHVGIGAEEAAARDDVVTLTAPLADLDRAILEGDTEGFGRVHIQKKTGCILGATLVSEHAGESIGEVALAMTVRAGIGALSTTIHPYPTVSEVWKRLGDQWQRHRLTPLVARILRAFLGLFRRER